MGLLDAGVARAIDVDASREYIAAARAEAERHGLADRVTYRYGDVVELAADLPPADIVTLDSVICCYPYLPALTAAAMSVSPRLVGFHLSPRRVVDAGVYAGSITCPCLAPQPGALLRASPRPVQRPHGLPARKSRSTTAVLPSGGSCYTREASCQRMGLVPGNRSRVRGQRADRGYRATASEPRFRANRYQRRGDPDRDESRRCHEVRREVGGHAPGGVVRPRDV